MNPLRKIIAAILGPGKTLASRIGDKPDEPPTAGAAVPTAPPPTPPPLKRIIRDRYLTDEEAAKYNKIREQVAEDLPDLIEQHNKYMAEREKDKNL